MKNKILLILSVALISLSCNKWLDVKPRTQISDSEMFTKESGFKSSLTACYIKLNDRNIYGQNMTMTVVEALAQNWEVGDFAHPELYQIQKFDYKNSYSKSVITSIYSNLYNVIAQANSIITNEDKINVIKDIELRSIILAEAYAIRAFCHFDVLRLFGQMPQGGTIAISLPYTEKISKDAPPYYDYNQFLNKILADLSKAEELLKDYDPILNYTYSELNTGVKEDGTTIEIDPYLKYRRFRFNYYAVKSLMARVYMYAGDKTNAYTQAVSIINAKDKYGKLLVDLSGDNDFSRGYYSAPSECLLALSNFQLGDYIPSLLGAGTNDARVESNQLYMTESKFNTLFSNLTQSNRYNYVWNKFSADGFGVTKPSLRKYYQPTGATGVNLATHQQVIPLIRLSEMYLIAMECTTDLAEGNKLYSTYMRARNVSAPNVFTTKPALDNEIINEYRRELFGEGQMFFTYKRKNSTTMLWKIGAVNENNYIIPLPDSEYNPNN